MATGYYCIGGKPWESVLALDEFGPGTLDGKPADGASFDACGPAALENGCAAYEGRAPSYANMGRIRRDMIENEQWTQPASVSDPRTGGCTPAHVAWEIARLDWGHGRYEVAAMLDEQPVTLTAQQIRDAIHYQAYSVVMVFNAQALSGNEQNVQRHYVGIAAYGGDAGTAGQSGGTDHNGYGQVYVLNSDMAGQHGAAQGQWLWIDDVLKADPRAYVVLAPVPVTPPLDVPGALADVRQAEAELDDAARKLGSAASAANAANDAFVASLQAGPIQAAEGGAGPTGVEASGVYRLQYGDSLESIAAKLYGDPARAAAILFVNQQAGILINGDALPINSVILLP